MKRLTLLPFVLFALLFAGACSETNSPTTAEETPASLTIGELHTEFLTRTYTRLDRSSDTNAVFESAYLTAVKMAEEHDIQPLTREETRHHFDSGRQMAQEDPVVLINEYLSDRELLWWTDFSDSATVKGLREQYSTHASQTTCPQLGTRLGDLMDVAVSSAEFWTVYREGQEPSYINPYCPVEDGDGVRGWKKKLLRFTVFVLVDGVSGGLAAAGGGGPIGGAIIGGLASVGADELLFGDD